MSATAMKAAASAMKPSAKTRLSASRKASRHAPVIKAAERAGMSAGLRMR